MREHQLNSLSADGFITPEQHKVISDYHRTKPFSLHWELKSILYCGVMLLATGAGMLIYDNIGSIGHIAIISCIALCCAGCFYFVHRHSKPYSNEEVKYDSPYFDYVLLLGSLLFLSLEGYLQIQYSIFGTHYGLATLIPAVLFFFLAYRYDHRGVLSLAVTALASWVGITTSPVELFKTNFTDSVIIYSGIGLGIVLLILSTLLQKNNIKPHFTFTYHNFGANILFICLLGALFTSPMPWIFFILLVVASWYFIRYAIHEKSLFFLLIAVIYGYIGLTWLAIRYDAFGAIGFYYFIASGAGALYLLMSYKKLFKEKQDGL